MRLACHASQLMNYCYLLYSGKLAFTYHTCTTYWFWNWVTLACHASQLMNSTYVLPIHNHLHYVFFFFCLFWDCSTPPIGAIAWHSSLGFLYYYMQESCNYDSGILRDSSLWSTSLYKSKAVIAIRGFAVSSWWTFNKIDWVLRPKGSVGRYPCPWGHAHRLSPPSASRNGFVTWYLIVTTWVSDVFTDEAVIWPEGTHEKFDFVIWFILIVFTYIHTYFRSNTKFSWTINNAQLIIAELGS